MFFVFVVRVEEEVKREEEVRVLISVDSLDVRSIL